MAEVDRIALSGRVHDLRDIADRAPSSLEPPRTAHAVLNGSMGIDLNEHATNSGEAFDPSRTGLDHLGFSVSSYDALVAWSAHLDNHGVAHSPIRNIAGVGEGLDFLDPDGIQLELWHKDHSGWWVGYVQKKLDQSRSDVPALVPEDA